MGSILIFHRKFYFLFSFLLLTSHSPQTESLPLSTSGRWVIDSTSGRRIKLHCVNWAAHLQPVLPEGLDRQPVEAIAANVKSLGFNCLRLTWATRMWTDEFFAKLTASTSLQLLGLQEQAAGLARNNQRMADMNVKDVFEAVVMAAAEAGLMLVLDNHVSRPQWCCGDDDGNGFYGDADFNTEEWLQGLEAVAARFRGVPQVIGMSLRNELRGPRQNVTVWRKNMARGCETIHKINPNLLVVVSGLSYDTDLGFLRRRPLRLSFSGKLVHEIHTYAFSNGQRTDWAEKPLTSMCIAMHQRFDEQAGFLTRGSTAVPLFVSEFGGDQTGASLSDNRFMSCFFAMAADRDLDWALWALQGSYYVRNGQANSEEMFGVFNKDWSGPRNPLFAEHYRLMQQMLQGPETSSVIVYKIIYHPASGRCLSVKEGQVQLMDCEHQSRWSYEGKVNAVPSAIRLVGTGEAYLKVVGEGRPIAMTTSESSASQWSIRSISGVAFQIAVAVKDVGKDLCFESDDYHNSSAVVARECMCLEGQTCLFDEDPRPQWFVFISANLLSGKNC